MRSKLHLDKVITLRYPRRCYYCQEEMRVGDSAQYLSWDIISDYNEIEYVHEYFHPDCVEPAFEDGISANDLLGL